MLLYIVIFIISLTALLIASDKFVESAERIGLALGIPSFIVGVTIVAFGTSLPELATSLASVFNGTSEIVVGNAVGSNITNILLVLGATAVVGKGIKIDYDVMNTDIPMLFGSAFLLYFTLQDFKLSNLECILLLVALVIFLANSFKGDGMLDQGEDRQISKPDIKDWLIVLVGAIAIYFSADYTIYAMENLARLANVPPHIIAVTVVALGTSLPEVVVSVSAARKGQHAMAVGNVLGSNIFNTYAVMAIPGLVGSLTIPPDTLAFHIPFMVVATLIFGIMCLSKRISRWEGYLLLIFYIYFIGTSIDSQLTIG